MESDDSGEETLCGTATIGSAFRSGESFFHRPTFPLLPIARPSVPLRYDLSSTSRRSPTPIRVDATPFYEPGEPDFSQMMDVGLRPERIYHANRLMTFTQDSAFPDAS